MNFTGLAVVIVIFILLTGIRIAKEYQRAVVFRLGRYTGLRGPGLFWLIPLGIENETRIDLRVVTAPIEQQETITLRLSTFPFEPQFTGFILKITCVWPHSSF